MLEKGQVWFLLADGRRARVFAEATRGADLSEVWAMEIGPEDAYAPQDRPPRAYDRVGAGRHAMDAHGNLHEREEENFLHRLARRIDAAEMQRAFVHLVISAPPRALGVLRKQLSAAALAKLRADTPKDLLDEPSDNLRARLHELLR